MTAIASAEAYFRVVEDGLPKKLHREITSAMYCLNAFERVDGKPCLITTSEIAGAIRVQRDLISPRMPELLRLGVVKKCARKKCTVTGFSCGTWVLTGNKAVVPNKRYFMECSHCDGHGKIEIFKSAVE